MTSIATIIRKTSTPTLRAYFEHSGIGLPANIDWAVPEPEILPPLLKAVDELTDTEKARLALDAGRIGDLVSEVGQIALYSVAEDKAVLDSLGGAHDRAFWMFLNHPDRFRRAEEVRYTDERRRGRSWAGFIVAADQPLNKDPAALDAFKTALRECFASPNIHIDIFDRRRPTFDGEDCELIQIAVYREGLPDDVLEFDAGDLVRRVRSPVFEAALTYEPATGVVEVVANDSKSREAMARIMVRDLLEIEFTSEKMPSRNYDLSSLQQHHAFPRDAADGIESVTLKQLRLMPMDNQGQRVTLECMRGSEETIWEMAARHFGDRNPLLGGWVVTQAKLNIAFQPKGDARRGRVLALTITMPHGCNLKDLTPEEQLIGEKYLRRWGILSGDTRGDD